MLNITIKGKAGEGKTRTAKLIKSYWEMFGKKVFINEGGEDKNPRKINVLITTLQD